MLPLHANVVDVALVLLHNALSKKEGSSVFVVVVDVVVVSVWKECRAAAADSLAKRIYVRAVLPHLASGPEGAPFNVAVLPNDPDLVDH